MNTETIIDQWIGVWHIKKQHFVRSINPFGALRTECGILLSGCIVKDEYPKCKSCQASLERKQQKVKSVD